MLGRPILVCVGITGLLHLVTYLLNTQLPLRLVGEGARPAQIGWLFTVTAGTATLLRPLAGAWADRRGSRVVMVPGAGLLLAAVLGLGLVRAPWSVVTLMAGVGAAGALLSTVSSLVVATESPTARRGEALSLYYVAASTGAALGPALGVPLAGDRGQALTFVVLVAAALAIGGLALSLGPGPPSGPPAIRPGWPWSRPALPASAVLAVVTTGAATVYAFLPLHAAAAGLGHAAWFFPLMSACTIACRLLLRRATDRFGRMTLLVPALATLAAGHAVLAVPPTILSLVLGAALLGAGTSMVYPTLVALVVDRVPAGERGRAVGTLAAAWDVGLAVGSPLIALLVDRRGYPAGFLASGLAAAGGLTLALAILRQPVSPEAGARASR